MKRYLRYLIPAGALAVVLVVLLVNLSGSLVYFITPTDLVSGSETGDRQRLGGQVVPGTVEDLTDGVAFTVTDGRFEVAVRHDGAPQDLFQEGIGVVLEGTWDGATFHSDTMLIRHDEQYRTEDGESYDHESPEEFAG